MGGTNVTSYCGVFERGPRPAASSKMPNYEFTVRDWDAHKWKIMNATTVMAEQHVVISTKGAIFSSGIAKQNYEWARSVRNGKAFRNEIYYPFVMSD